MKIFTIIFTLLLAAPSAWALQGPSAHFDTDKETVINETEITTFAESVSRAATDVTIYCHTDTRASVEYNIELAGRRCDSVERLLGGYNLVIHKVNVVGEEKPLVDENGEKCSREALNRRVEIFYELAPEKVVEFRRHRIHVAVGYAPSGLKPTRQIGPKTYEVEEDWDPELGIGYSFRLTRRWNIGVEGFTNKSIFGTLGIDF